MNNLEEMDKFLKYNLPKVNQEQIQNLNRTIRSMEIKICIETNEDESMTKPLGFSKSSAKGKVHSNTSLPQETGEKSNK